MSVQVTCCLWILVLFLISCDLDVTASSLKYLWGDAIHDPLAPSPIDGQPYPWELATKIAGRQLRHARTFGGGMPDLLTPEDTSHILLKSLQIQNGYGLHWSMREGSGRSFQKENQSSRRQGLRKGRSKGGNETTTSNIEEPVKDEVEGCVPSICPIRYNTTAPMYGISLTSGKPVTIVQKFPDLLQQVVFQVCKSGDCDVIHGECVQTFVPYLFLVLPLGPVSITGQDYILVESGCTCQPRYAKRQIAPPLPFIQPIN